MILNFINSITAVGMEGFTNYYTLRYRFRRVCKIAKNDS